MIKIAKQVTVFDSETGEIFSDSTNYGSQNGENWVIWYRSALSTLAEIAPDFSTLKVFLKLASKQEFETGINTTKQALADELKISYVSVMKAFKWLKENDYVKERKVNGQTQFLLNPKVTTCGRNRKAKIELWESV